MKISVLILTLNEEASLPKCLESLSWCDDVVVFDSYSHDKTVDIAKQFGARVFKNQFRNYGQQREDARTKVLYKHTWVLAIDADERPDKDLVEEIASIDEDEYHSDICAYRIRRKDHFMGHWIKHSTLYPSWFIRLYRNDRIQYPERAVHEYPDVKGRIGELKGHLLHYSFNKGLTEWIGKHNRYSEFEAKEAIKALENTHIDWGKLREMSDPVQKRRFLKSISYRLPLRPLFRFGYMYLVRKGCLDGLPGLTYCSLLAIYEYFIVLKMEEIRRGNVVE